MVLKPTRSSGHRGGESGLSGRRIPDGPALAAGNAVRPPVCRAALRERRRVILLCGHYEAIDERVKDSLVDEELSIGDYVLTGGELAALVVIDAATRLVPGVLGDEESAYRDSFGDGLLDHPHYTRPPSSRHAGARCPALRKPRRHHEMAPARVPPATLLKRPGLLEAAELTKKIQEFSKSSEGI